jgi:hypothetical protein
VTIPPDPFVCDSNLMMYYIYRCDLHCMRIKMRYLQLDQRIYLNLLCCARDRNSAQESVNDVPP